jgi:hypothetical protein
MTGCDPPGDTRDPDAQAGRVSLDGRHMPEDLPHVDGLRHRADRVPSGAERTAPVRAPDRAMRRDPARRAVQQDVTSRDLLGV